jgi:ketosteroid isomerase-like protein
MIDDRLQIIHRSYRAFADGDVDALLALYHPEAVWDMTRWENWPEAPTYERHEGIARILRLLGEAFGELRLTPTEMVDTGDGRVFVEGRMTVRGASSGATVDAPPYGQVIRFRDGLTLRVDNYTDVAAARADAGLAS